ncbi:unnamed protein product [Symbiodinium microadriaticum]|nr:unnamed protein product [Symbiodinium microadriaticum]
MLLRTPPGTPKFQQDDPIHEIARQRRQEQGSGASLSSETTCDSTAPQHGSPAEAGDSETANPNFKETLPGALRAKMGELPFEALPVAEVEIESDATSASAECLDRSSDQDIDEDWTGEEFVPHDLLMPNLLPFLSVQELLNWRLLSRHTRSPKVLTDHVAEMGRMDRPETIDCRACGTDEAGRKQPGFAHSSLV